MPSSAHTHTHTHTHPNTHTHTHTHTLTRTHTHTHSTHTHTHSHTFTRTHTHTHTHIHTRTRSSCTLAIRSLSFWPGLAWLDGFKVAKFCDFNKNPIGHPSKLKASPGWGGGNEIFCRKPPRVYRCKAYRHHRHLYSAGRVLSTT